MLELPVLLRVNNKTSLGLIKEDDNGKVEYCRYSTNNIDASMSLKYKVGTKQAILYNSEKDAYAYIEDNSNINNVTITWVHKKNINNRTLNPLLNVNMPICDYIVDVCNENGKRILDEFKKILENSGKNIEVVEQYMIVSSDSKRGSENCLKITRTEQKFNEYIQYDSTKKSSEDNKAASDDKTKSPKVEKVQTKNKAKAVKTKATPKQKAVETKPQIKQQEQKKTEPQQDIEEPKAEETKSEVEEQEPKAEETEPKQVVEEPKAEETKSEVEEQEPKAEETEPKQVVEEQQLDTEKSGDSEEVHQDNVELTKQEEKEQESIISEQDKIEGETNKDIVTISRTELSDFLNEYYVTRKERDEFESNKEKTSKQYEKVHELLRFAESTYIDKAEEKILEIEQLEYADSKVRTTEEKMYEPSKFLMYEYILKMLRERDSISIPKEYYKELSILLKKNMIMNKACTYYISLVVIRFNRDDKFNIFAVAEYDESLDYIRITVVKPYSDEQVTDEQVIRCELAYRKWKKESGFIDGFIR